MIRNTILFLLLLAPSIGYSQDWDKSLLKDNYVVLEDKVQQPVPDARPNADWYEELMKLSAKLQEQGEQIKKLSETLKEKNSLEDVQSGSSIAELKERVETLSKRVEGFLDKEKKENPLEAAPKAEVVPTPAPEPTAEDKRIVVEMHTFADGRVCTYCDRWLAVESPKFDRSKYDVIVIKDIVGQKVPRFRVCRGGTCLQEIVGYITAESLIQRIRF